MRRYVSISLSLLVAGLFSVVSEAHAVPSTAGGPAGYGTTDGTSNLTVWLRAEDLGGGPVSNWTDQSGYGNDAAQSDTDRQPGFLTNELNTSLPALTFDGANASGPLRDRLEIPDDTSLRPTGMSLFTVGRSRDTGYGAYFSKFSNGGWNDGWGINEESGAPGALQMWGTNTTPGAPLAHTLDTYGVFSATHDDPNDVRRVWARGAAGPNDATIDPIGYTTPGVPALIGDNPDISTIDYFLTGEIAEIIFSNSPVNDPQRQIITNYLSSKYNLPLDTEDRYDGDTSINGHHDFDVFGSGSDGTDSVTSAGSKGFGVEAINSSLGSDEWVLAGHKVETNGLVFSDIDAAGVTQRWERAWYLDKTGDIDATLAFDFSDAGLTLPAEASNFTLLYRANEGVDFTSAGSFLQSGDLLTIDLASIDLPDGIYTVGFFAPPIPEPSSLMLLGLGMLGLCFGRRRRRGVRQSSTRQDFKAESLFSRSYLQGSPNKKRALAVLRNIVLSPVAVRRTGAILAVVLTIFCVMLTTASAVELAHWRFDGNMNDSSGNGINLTPVNSPAFGAPVAPFGTQSVDLSIPSQQYGVATTPSGFNFTAAYSVAGWVRMPSPAGSGQRPVFWRGLGSAGDIEIYNQQGNDSIFVVHNRNNAGTLGFHSASGLPGDTPTHLAVTYDGTDVRIYFDGVLQGSAGAVPTPAVTGSFEIRVGSAPSIAGFYEDFIDELFVFNTVLSLEEINNLIEFNATSEPLPIPEPSSLALVAFVMPALAGHVRRRRRRYAAQHRDVR